MIALPISSQKRYIINKDTLVCYTNSENRAIAILLLKGDKAAYNNVQDSIIIKTLQSDKVILQNKVLILTESVELHTSQIRQLNSDLMKVSDKQKYSHRWAVIWRNVTITLSGIISIFVLLK